MGAGARRLGCSVVAVNESRDVRGDNGSPGRVGSNALWRLLTDRGWARGVRDRELFVFRAHAYTPRVATRGVYACARKTKSSRSLTPRAQPRSVNSRQRAFEPTRPGDPLSPRTSRDSLTATTEHPSRLAPAPIASRRDASVC